MKNRQAFHPPDPTDEAVNITLPPSDYGTTLQDNIHTLTQNLHSLESKYLNLANFYKNQSKSPRKRKTPRTELRDQIKKDLQPARDNYVNPDLEKSLVDDALVGR